MFSKELVMYKKILLIIILLLFIVSCKDEVTLIGGTVSQVDQMKADNSDLPIIPYVDLPKNTPETIAPAVVTDVPPAEYAPMIKEQKEAEKYVTTGIIDLEVYNIGTSYESIKEFSFIAHNGLKKKVKDVVLVASAEDIMLREFKFGELERNGILVRENFQTKISIGENKEMEFKIGEYIDNEFVEYGEINVKI